MLQCFNNRNHNKYLILSKEFTKRKRILNKIGSIFFALLIFSGCSSPGNNSTIGNEKSSSSAAINKNNSSDKEVRGKPLTEDEMIKITEEQYKEQLALFREKDWNKEENNPEKNGNINRILDIMGSLDDFKLPSYTVLEPKIQDILNDVSNYYGEKIKFEGRIIELKENTSESQISKTLFNGKKCTSILFETEDGGKVQLYITGDVNYSSMFRSGDEIEFCGWPVGISNEMLILVNKFIT